MAGQASNVDTSLSAHHFFFLSTANLRRSIPTIRLGLLTCNGSTSQTTLYFATSRLGEAPLGSLGTLVPLIGLLQRSGTMAMTPRHFSSAAVDSVQ